MPGGIPFPVRCPVQNSLYFGMFLILVTWLIACLSIWFCIEKEECLGDCIAWSGDAAFQSQQPAE